MRGLLIIYRRELLALFLTPLAWLLLCIALPLNGFLFVAVLGEYGGDLTRALRYMLGESFVFWGLMVFLPPLLTMRQISEESRTGVLEYLLTAPVTDAAVVCGKLLAATTVMALFWLSNLVYGLAAHGLGTAPDWPALLCAYVGAVLASALFVSIGLVASAFSGTPLLAAVLAFAGSVLVLLLPFAQGVAGLPEGHWSGEILAQLDVTRRYMGSFMMGVLDLSHVVFFLVWTFFFGFLATRLVESRRWR